MLAVHAEQFGCTAPGVSAMAKMSHNHILGMVCGYYLSRFDQIAYEHLGHPTQDATHAALGVALGVPPTSIKNWRDEFDPVHGNARQGWHKREMYPTRRRVIEALGELSEGELFALVRHIADSPADTEAQELVSAVGDVDDKGAPGSYALRGPTGRAAEAAFISHHSKSALPIDGVLKDCREDQVGYDFKIIGAETALVEVKGLAGDTGGISLTDKEWATARKCGDAYYLALVRNVATSPHVWILRNPASRLTAKARVYTVVQVGWAVGEASLRNAEQSPST